MRNVSCPLILLEMFARCPHLQVVGGWLGDCHEAGISGRYHVEVRVNKMSLYQW